jgi:hypothetical protein
VGDRHSGCAWIGHGSAVAGTDLLEVPGVAESGELFVVSEAGGLRVRNGHRNSKGSERLWC